MEALDWKKSSFCEGSGCVEVATDPGVVYVRSSHGDHLLIFTDTEWQAFVEGVKAGEFG
jgi:uncharacterized protein DUF397